MRRLSFLLPLLPLALGQNTVPGPRYEEWTKYLLSQPDYRLEQLLKGRWPFLEVLRKDRYQEYQKGPCDPQKDPNACKDRMPWNEAQAHEFRLPMSSLEATREVARDLRKAWQRFEERYYWRVITELNNPAFWLTYCGFGLKGPDLDPPLPEVRLNVPSESLDTAFLGKLTPFDPGKIASAGLHSLDRYLPVPQVKAEDFCDDLGLNLLPIMYIPGFKVMVQGTEIFRTPGYPSRPFWFNSEAADARVKAAMRHAFERYYPQYLEEVARILLTPRPNTPQDLLSGLGGDFQSLGAPKAYLPIPWQGHLLNGGAVVAPVYTELLPRDPQALWNTIQGIWDTYKALIDKAGSEVEKVYLYVHFYRSVRVLYDSKAFYGIPGVADTLKQQVKALVETPLRTLTQGIPVLKGCTGSLDEVAGCAARGLMLVDSALKLGNDLTGLTGGKPQNEPIKGMRESPGLWKFEEAKRWFPPASLPVYEAFGYTSLFQAFNILEATNVPDIRNVDLSQINLGNWVGWAWSQLSRLVVYWHVPLTIDIRIEYCPPCVLAYPSLPLEGPAQPLGVPPYTLPFVAERTHWRWVSVPEGYEIPGVRGTPYKVLGDLGGIAPDLSFLYRPLIGR
ncbi:hypothetical protein [Thermus albus]|uniref:hypothetical protein n=1 Tax=Thermus albus TaxID=2908146 RepID=UPI001FAA012F|nr:hypothetical protein [Thermus albus]